MGAFDWLFGKQEIPGRAQAAFDHPKVYGEVGQGPGVHALSTAAAMWATDVSKAFNDADLALDRVLKDSEVLMEGPAADQAREAVRPLSQATQEAEDVAVRASALVEQQAQGSADFKNVFLKPHQVPPDNIGWGDYVNPYAFALKSGVRAGHEEIRDQIEAQARQQYEDYTRSTNERVNAIPQFSPPPKFTADVEPAKTDPVHKVEPLSSHTSTTGTRDESERPVASPVADPGPPSAPAVPHEPTASDAAPVAPAESGSAWVAPTASGSPVTGGSVPAPGGGGGVTGGVVVPPGGSGGRPAQPGSGHGGTGRGVPGGGTGRGGDTGKGLPGGGRSGSGSGPTAPGSTGSGTSAARGSSGGGGVAGGPPAAGGNRQKEDDKEHDRKFVKGDRDAWSDLELPKVAPAVFGDWEAEALKGKPPRPPEQM
ncbi:hypothetical protein SAMN02982929_06937 [Saccharopolyspora kobensis]|uniref:PPE family protein n=1 Tax=Saccharopolyspora kobensis TaxID=146035 RepID=A0A1H6EJ96_9PSEU|nr:hypothetical protein [Saccharopolyspora kobensis]SEG97937.1 hypothetical protein SAMN02982929_06937 [Saccharopolyspora kobensis]SFF23470.1 hypothetical protein SAMN05216506_1235 [Saccharopolyspora kobensis]